MLSFAFWTDHRVVDFLQRDAEPICWPLVPECERIRVLSFGGINVALMTYLALAVATFVLFLQRERTRWAYGGLVALEIMKTALILLDFRMRMNQHYMASFASLAFLFAPHKREALRVLVRLFYFWAGTLKLDSDWLSGASLYRPLWLIEGRAIAVACVYVVVLELVIAWGLFAKTRWVFWTTFGQLLLFHVMSFPIVGFFYPLLMFALLSIFPLCRLFPERESRLAPSTYVVAALFSLLQLVPYGFPGDHALTGEGRLFALHMFDARAACVAHADLKSKDGTRTRVSLKSKLDARVACDPIVFHSRARQLCRGRAFEDLDLLVASRRVSRAEGELRTIVDIADFCSRDIRYDPIRHNAWISAE